MSYITDNEGHRYELELTFTPEAGHIYVLKPPAPVVEDRRKWKYYLSMLGPSKHSPLVDEFHELTPKAATAVASAIKSLLEYVNTPDNLTVSRSEHEEAAYRAKQAVQRGDDE